MPSRICALLCVTLGATKALVVGSWARALKHRQYAPRMEFGDAFYMGYNYEGTYGPQPGDPILPTEGDTWTPALPERWVEVALRTPLGIKFEENDAKNSGVYVLDLVEDGNAAKSGLIAPGDQLVGVTGVRIMGGKYERIMCDCRKWDFDTVVDAITSNEPKFNCQDVLLRFEHPSS
jgi:hypothetical protein